MILHQFIQRQRGPQARDQVWIGELRLLAELLPEGATRSPVSGIKRGKALLLLRCLQAGEAEQGAERPILRRWGCLEDLLYMGLLQLLNERVKLLTQFLGNRPGGDGFLQGAALELRPLCQQCRHISRLVLLEEAVEYLRCHAELLGTAVGLDQALHLLRLCLHYAGQQVHIALIEIGHAQSLQMWAHAAEQLLVFGGRPIISRRNLQVNGFQLSGIEAGRRGALNLPLCIEDADHQAGALSSLEKLAGVVGDLVAALRVGDAFTQGLEAAQLHTEYAHQPLLNRPAIWIANMALHYKLLIALILAAPRLRSGRSGLQIPCMHQNGLSCAVVGCTRSVAHGDLFCGEAWC